MMTSTKKYHVVFKISFAFLKVFKLLSMCDGGSRVKMTIRLENLSW